MAKGSGGRGGTEEVVQEEGERRPGRKAKEGGGQCGGGDDDDDGGGGGRGMCPKRRMHAETRKRYIRGLAAGDGRPGPSFFHLYVRYSHAQT